MGVVADYTDFALSEAVGSFARYAETCGLKWGNGDCNFTRQDPGLLGVFVIFFVADERL
jgi:hypothetical protein